MFYILDENNIPVEYDVFDKKTIEALLLQNHIVRQDESNSIKISTVFTGINLRFPGSDFPPVFFETMVLKKNNVTMWGRYCEWDDAYDGHIKALNEYTSIFEEFKRVYR